LPMEASVNPSYRRLRPEKWEASPDRAGSSHTIVTLPCLCANTDIGISTSKIRRILFDHFLP
ncbi:hypothetical protein ACX1IP_22540, partial [Yersinia enterocolitica]